ncbi:hypothetical protein EJP69_14255 [Variovorax gossypii]|uniref:Uncharacterized protein n=1 Tax=Variovorax gossypii TaxID=1679495 RepID=A0A3S0H2C0_9BURK|nr:MULTISPECIES: hypothetical protein [Variovorax]MDR6522183.1 hypothetical protein [Variovorax paradoxus]RTQ35520.1 hypothetical protein EJP69_14255 [Variovorax gossypii]
MLFQKSAPFGVQQSEDNPVHLHQLSLALSNSHFLRIVAIAADAERFLQLLPWRALRVRGPQQGTTVSVAAAEDPRKVVLRIDTSALCLLTPSQGWIHHYDLVSPSLGGCESSFLTVRAEHEDLAVSPSVAHDADLPAVFGTPDTVHGQRIRHTQGHGRSEA